MRKAVCSSQKCLLLALLLTVGTLGLTQSQAQSAVQRLVAPRPWWRAATTNAPTGDAPPQGPVAAPNDNGGPRSTVVKSWEGMRSDFTLEPPDPHGAAGPNGVIQAVNLRIQ